MGAVLFVAVAAARIICPYGSPIASGFAGGVAFYCRDTNDRNDGPYERVLHTGERVQLGHHLQHQRDGLWQEWNRAGVLIVEEHYADGRLDGLRRTWYENGQPESEATYGLYNRNGRYREWYANGSPREDAVYRNGSRERGGRMWSADGKETDVSPTLLSWTFGLTIGGTALLPLPQPASVRGGFSLGYRQELVVTPSSTDVGVGAYAEALTAMTFTDFIGGAGVLVRPTRRSFNLVPSLGGFARFSHQLWQGGPSAGLFYGVHSSETTTGALGVRVDVHYALGPQPDVVITFALQLDLSYPAMLFKSIARPWFPHG